MFTIKNITKSPESQEIREVHELLGAFFKHYKVQDILQMRGIVDELRINHCH